MIAFNAYTRLPVTGDGDVRIWNLRDLEEEPRRLATNSPHVDCLAFNHSGSILASSGDGRIRLWDTTNHQCLADITDGSRVVESISFSPDDKTIAAGNWVGKVCLWDVQTRRRTTVLPESTCVHSVCYSTDSTHLCSASDSNTLRLWDVVDRSYVVGAVSFMKQLTSRKGERTSSRVGRGGSCSSYSG